MSTLKIPTQGLSNGEAFLEFEPGLTQCGNITDGVALALGVPELGGWWVIAFDNLEVMYLSAKAARAK